MPWSVGSGDIEPLFHGRLWINIKRYDEQLSSVPLLTDQFVYSAEIFLIAALSLSKLSTALLVQKISPKNNIRTASWIAIGLIAVWTVFAILGNVLQCGLPNPWTCPGKVRYFCLVYHCLTVLAACSICHWCPQYPDRCLPDCDPDLYASKCSNVSGEATSD